MSEYNESFSKLDDAMAGIDRAALNVYAQPEHHGVSPSIEQRTPSLPSSSDSDEQQTKTKGLANVRRLSGKVKSRVKTKTTKIFQSSKDTQVQQHQTARVLAPAPSTENDDDRLFDPVPEHKGPKAKDLLHHPMDTVQSVMHGASGEKMAAVMDNQSMAHGADVNLVRAHDKVSSADDEENRHLAIRELQDLKKARQDTYVRWTMDRHVLKVRRIPPGGLPRPQKKDFTVADQKGIAQVQWARYGQHVRHAFNSAYSIPSYPVRTLKRLKRILNKLSACAVLRSAIRRPIHR